MVADDGKHWGRTKGLFDLFKNVQYNFLVTLARCFPFSVIHDVASIIYVLSVLKNFPQLLAKLTGQIIPAND